MRYEVTRDRLPVMRTPSLKNATRFAFGLMHDHPDSEIELFDHDEQDGVLSSDEYPRCDYCQTRATTRGKCTDCNRGICDGCCYHDDNGHGWSLCDDCAYARTLGQQLGCPETPHSLGEL